MIRRVLLAAMLLCFASTGHAQLMDVFQFSGYQWVKWDTPSKYGYIGGFIAGGAYNAIASQTGMIDKMPDKGQVPEDKADKAGDTAKKDVITSLIMYLQDDEVRDLTRYFIKGIPSNEIVNGLDQLYMNHHHYGIKVVDAIYLVRKQHEGASKEEINATIEYLVSGKDMTKLHYRDKNGKFQAVKFP